MSVAKKAVISTLWTSGANYAAMGVGLVFGILRDRILLPYDNGVYAFGMATVDMLFILAAVSFNISIIGAEEEKEDLYSTAFVLTILLSLLMAIAAAGLAWILLLRGTVMIKVEAFLLLAAFSILNLFTILFTAYLEKQLEYKRIARVNLVSIVAFPVVSLILVSIGWGAWGMVFGQAASFIVSFIGMGIISRYPIGLRFNSRTARWFLSMGWKLIVTRGLEVVFVQYGTFVTEFLLGTVRQGSYNRVLKYWQMAPQTVAPAVVTVALPTYAKLQKEESKLDQAFQMVIFFLIRVLMPFTLVFLFLPAAFIRIIGTQWMDGVPVLQILAIAAILAPLFENMKQLLYAQGRPAHLIAIRVIQLAVFVPSMYFFVARFGIAGAALSVTINYVIGVAGLAIRLRVIRSLSKQFVVPLAAAALSGGAFLLIPVARIHAGAVLQFLAEACLLLGLFVIFELIFEWKSLRSFVTSIRQAVSAGVTADSARVRP